MKILFLHKNKLKISTFVGIFSFFLLTNRKIYDIMLAQQRNKIHISKKFKKKLLTTINNYVIISSQVQ